MKQFFAVLAMAFIMVGVSSCKKDDVAVTTVTYKATLSGASEVPAVATTATGTATLTYDTATKIFKLSATYSGLTATGAHIHKGAVGASGGVAFALDPFTSPISFTSPALDATQLADLTAGLYYINVHTDANKGGEIRGQLIKQ
jgi:hypothetical protein